MPNSLIEPNLIEPNVWGRLRALDARCDWRIERINAGVGPMTQGRRYGRAWTMQMWLRDEPGPRLITAAGPEFSEVLAEVVRVAEEARWHLPGE